MISRNRVVWVIVLVGFVLRLLSINQSFWLDEATSATVARDLSYKEIITKFAISDFHPPGYYLFLKTWGAVFGHSEVSLRLPSTIFALVTIYALYKLGRKVAGEKVGMLASLFLATSGLHIYYSQEARMYAMSTMFVVLAVYFFAKTFDNQNKRNLLWFSFSLLGILFSDYLPLVVILVFWLYALVNKRSGQWWRNFAYSHIPLVFGFLANLPILINQLSSGLAVETTTPLWYDILGRTTLKQILLVPVKFMFGRISFVSPLVYGFLAVMMGLIFSFLLFKAWNQKRGSLDWYWLAIPIVVTVLVGFKIPAFSYFRLLFVLPAFYILLARGVISLDRYILGKLLVALILVVNLGSSFYYLFNPKFHREDWRGLVRFIELNSPTNAATLFVADSQMEAYTFYATSVPSIPPSEFTGLQDTIWLMRYVQTVFDPGELVRGELEGLGYRKQSEHDFNGVVVWQYSK